MNNCHMYDDTANPTLWKSFFFYCVPPEWMKEIEWYLGQVIAQMCQWWISGIWGMVHPLWGASDKCPNHQVMGISTYETINKCCILVTLNTITWMEYCGPLYMERGMIGAPGNILLLTWTKPAQTVLKHPNFVTVELLAWNHIPK